MSEIKIWLEQNVHRTYNKNNQEFYIMLNFLEKHPNYLNWKNQEPEWFEITRSPKKKHIQVYVKFTNLKNKRLVSWKSCETGKINKTDNLSYAMRNSISEQTQSYRQSHYIKKCEICESYNNIEVDHYPKKFREIKSEFLELDFPIPKTRFYKNKIIFCNNSTFEEMWKEYHNQNATYRYLCSTCNQKSH